MPPVTPRVAGVALQLAALALFVGMDTLIKLLAVDYAVPQLMWARFVFHVLIMAAAIRVATGTLPIASRAPGLQALRSLALTGANLLFSLGLAQLPLADVTAVGFAAPVLTVALAALWLGETVGWRRWLGVGIGLVGVMVALRPPFLTGEALPPALLLPLGSAVMSALYQVLTRRLAGVDDPRTTILHTGLAATAVTSLAQPFVWIWPDATGWAALVLVGALGGVGHYLLVLAFARAPASLLAPMTYTQLVWAGLSGWLVFGDLPDGWTLAGAAVIALGGVLVALPGRSRG
jgi:drug/metabolite transporter (DMT)-like permease